MITSMRQWLITARKRYPYVRARVAACAVIWMFSFLIEAVIRQDLLPGGRCRL
jgi:hypothetical protein